MRGNKNEAIHKMASDLPPSWLPAAARSSSALASHHSQGLCPSFLDLLVILKVCVHPKVEEGQ